MRITHVDISPEGSSEIISLSLNSPSPYDPYLVKSITELDANELSSLYYGKSSDSTKRFYETSLSKREPVITLSLNPSLTNQSLNTYSKLRDNLYRCVSSSRTGLVSLIFKNKEESVSMLSCRIGNIETDHFSPTQEVAITFVTEKPYFRSLSRVEARPDLYKNLYSFSVTDNLSTSPHGVIFELELREAGKIFEISPPYTSIQPDWKFRLNRTNNFSVGTVFTISSETDNKKVVGQLGPNPVGMADLVATNSVFPIIFPGENQFKTNLKVHVKSARFYYTYWGI